MSRDFKDLVGPSTPAMLAQLEKAYGCVLYRCSGASSCGTSGVIADVIAAVGVALGGVWWSSYDGLGILGVKNVPGFVQKRANLLPLAYR